MNKGCDGMIMRLLCVLGCLCGPLATAHAQDARGQASPLVQGADVRISMDLKEADLKDVLKIFSQQSGMNFIASEQVKDRRVTLYLDQVSIQDALDSIVVANGLLYERPAGSDIFIVKEYVRPAVETETRIYTLGYARVSSSALGQSTALLGELTSSLIGQDTAFADPSGDTTTQQRNLNVPSSGAGIDQVIKAMLSEFGSLVVDGRTNSLIITEIPNRFPLIEDVIAKLDTPTPQVMIEVEILEVSRSAIDRIGVDWGQADGQIFAMTSASRTIAFPFTNLADRLGTEKTVTTGDLDGTSLAATVRALRQDGHTKLLARPRVLTLNNESAIIKIVSDTAIGVESTTVSDTGSVLESPERVETGISLTVTPQINRDNYVTMFIQPAVTRPIASEFFPDQFVDPQTRGASTLVRVKDGATVIIGGLLENNASETKRKMPLVGEIPLLGALFRSLSDSHSERELVVFITPHVIHDEVAVAQMQQPLMRVTAATEREQDGDDRLLKVEEIDRALSGFERSMERLLIPEEEHLLQ